jgi:hypothetical protein
MHRSPAGHLSAALRSVLTRCGRGLAPDSGRLLLVAVLLTVTGTLFAVLPAAGTGSTASTRVAVEPAAATHPVASPAGSSTPGRSEHKSDWGRRHHGDAAPPAAPAANGNCSLIVPAAPTTAAGLATPYRLTATDPRQGACHETNPDQSAFVEAAVFDPAAHTVAIYHPLVIDDHTSPAVPPAPLMLPGQAVVGVWFGFNGDTLTLAGPGAGSCVNGLPGSPFGQFAYCNASAFFTATTQDAAFQKTIPAIGTITTPGPAGRPCPTSRDFSVVDQDQSDNLATAYRIIGGRLAQVTGQTANQGTPLTNGSDEGLVAKFIAPTLGCTPFTAPDLTHDMAPTPALALNELSAAKFQPAPAALVPTSDPMTLVDGHPSVRKTNLYRAGVNQPPLPAGQTPQAYCAAILAAAPGSFTTNAALLHAATSPTPDQPNLLAFLKDRLTTTVQELGCAPVRAVGGPGQPNGQQTQGAPAGPGATNATTNRATNVATNAAPAGQQAGTAATPSGQHGTAAAAPTTPTTPARRSASTSGSSGSGTASTGAPVTGGPGAASPSSAPAAPAGAASGGTGTN